MPDSEITVISRSFRIVNSQGIHLRPASQLVQIFAEHPDAEVFISAGQTRVNAKSIMGLLMLEAAQGTEITVEVASADPDAILDRVGELIAAGFGEE